MTKSSFPPASASPQGQWAPHPWAGAAVVLGAGGLFTLIAAQVQGGAAVTGFDMRVAQWLHGHTSPWITQLMLAVSTLHSVPVILGMGLAFAAWLYWRHLPRWAVTVAVTLPAGMVLNVLLKHAFQRARPHFDDPLLTLATYSFPSGHTASATVLWGLVACYFASGRRWPAALAAAAGALAMVALVGVSRMYLGVHYLTDVLAALAEGVAWLALCVTGLATLWRRRAGRARSGGV